MIPFASINIPSMGSQSKHENQTKQQTYRFILLFLRLIDTTKHWLIYSLKEIVSTELNYYIWNCHVQNVCNFSLSWICLYLDLDSMLCRRRRRRTIFI